MKCPIGKNLTYRAKLLDPKPLPGDIMDKEQEKSRGILLVGGGITRRPTVASEPSRWRSAHSANDRSVTQGMTG